jgi:hypothetical protein
MVTERGPEIHLATHRTVVMMPGVEFIDGRRCDGV